MYKFKGQKEIRGSWLEESLHAITNFTVSGDNTLKAVWKWTTWMSYAKQDTKNFLAFLWKLRKAFGNAYRIGKNDNLPKKVTRKRAKCEGLIFKGEARFLYRKRVKSKMLQT